MITAAQVGELGSILGIWAHPDDESVTSGGLMSLAVQNGQSVVCVTATRGEAGSQDPIRWPLSSVGKIRALELAEALQVLGIKHHHWLGYHDGACDKVSDEEAVAKLVPLIQKYEPDTILTFSPDGLTGHDDHKTVSRWAVEAAAQSGLNPTVYFAVICKQKYTTHLKAMDEKLNMFFNIDQPKLYELAACDIAVELPREAAEKKCEALTLMPSQYESMFQAFPKDFVRDALAIETFVRAK